MTFDEWWESLGKNKRRALSAKDAARLAWNQQQALLDRLMLEHCQDEMTKEQIDEWRKHQKPEQE
jgi:hypothetical protein